MKITMLEELANFWAFFLYFCLKHHQYLFCSQYIVFMEYTFTFHLRHQVFFGLQITVITTASSSVVATHRKTGSAGHHGNNYWVALSHESICTVLEQKVMTGNTVYDNWLMSLNLAWLHIQLMQDKFFQTQKICKNFSCKCGVHKLLFIQDQFLG